MKYIMSILDGDFLASRRQIMKKTSVLITSLCALGAAVAMAAGPVSSVNAVGYVNVTVPSSGGFVLCALNFQKVGDTNGAISFMELFGTNQLRASGSPQGSDRVLLFNPDQQIYYKYAFKGSDFHQISPTNMWSDVAENPMIKSGQGFWLQSGNSMTSNIVTLAGEVLNSSSTTVSVVTGYQIYGNQYSSSLNITTSTFVNAFAGGSPQGSDQIMLFKNGGYLKYALSANDGQWHMIYPVNNWSGDAETNGIAVNVGEGFWYKAKTGSVWDSTIPYSLK